MGSQYLRPVPIRALSPEIIGRYDDQPTERERVECWEARYEFYSRRRSLIVSRWQSRHTKGATK